MIWLMEILRIFLEEQLPDKVLFDKAFDIAKNLKYDGYQRGLASRVYKIFDKKTLGGALVVLLHMHGQTP